MTRVWVCSDNDRREGTTSRHVRHKEPVRLGDQQDLGELKVTLGIQDQEIGKLLQLFVGC